MRRTFGIAAHVGALVALSVTLSGCYSKATAYHGKFTVAYASGVDIENFVKPVAPGAKLEVVAFANGTEDKLVITKATSSRRAVLSVETIDQQSITLLGGEPGVADLEITARDAAGNVLVDKMFFHVAKPSVHRLQHSCTEDRDAIYVKGDNIDIFHRLATSDGRPVIGYAYAPVRVEPAGALELVAQPQGSGLYRFRAPATKESISIRSTVDGGVLSLRVVERAALSDAVLDYRDRIIEGESEYVVAHVRLGERELCSQNALTRARSLTPEVCRVSARLDEAPEDDSNREQVARITGLKFGVCELEVTLPELDDGHGVVLAGRVKIGKTQFPGDSTSPSAPPSEPWWRVDRGAAARSWFTAWWSVTRLAALVWVMASLVRSRKR